MVLGYICQEHGYQHSCDVAKSGERICNECGNAVTGLTGRLRGRKAPPSNKPSYQEGSIWWTVKLGYSGESYSVTAFDYIDAVNKVIPQLDDPQEISEVYPQKVEYRK